MWFRRAEDPRRESRFQSSIGAAGPVRWEYEQSPRDCLRGVGIEALPHFHTRTRHHGHDAQTV